MQHARPAWRAPAAQQPSRPRLIRATVHPGSSGPMKVVPSPGQPDANTPTPAVPAATPVAPASDLETRQLQLLPWHASASTAAPQEGAAGASQDADITSTGTTAAPVANIPAAGPTALGQCNGPSNTTAWPQCSRAAYDLGSSAAVSSSPPNGAEAKAASSSSSRGSTRLVQASALCEQWQQRPDYRPGGSLLTLLDVNLSALDSNANSGSDSSCETDEGGIGGSSRRRRKTGPMSAERREAISRALQSKGAKSAEHKRSISRAMREAHARNPQLRRSAVGLKKRCGHCGQEGHNRRACPQLLAAAANTRPAGGEVATAPASKVIVIEEVDEAVLQLGTAAFTDDSSSNNASGSNSLRTASGASIGAAAVPSSSSSVGGGDGGMASRGAAAAGSAVVLSQGAAAASSPPPPPYTDLLPTLRLAPGMSLSPEGGWIFPLPRTKDECVAQAAQAVLRAWDDGMRRQVVELLLPQADPTADGGWPGGIRQQFRVAKPMVESLLLRLKQHEGLEGRITAEFLDEGDCVGAWQSERLGAVLFATADTLPDLRRIDDALSGERLTLVINPQWQTQGQVISDFGIGRTRQVAERFVAALEEVYYLRRVRIFGDDVRIMRCYPGQWQMHYIPPDTASETVLLSCEDAKPTFQRLIELLKAVRGSRASKTWLDRVLTSSMGSFNEFAAYSSPEEANAAAAAAASPSDNPGSNSSGGGHHAASATAAAMAEEQQQRGDGNSLGLLHDIVTGELILAEGGNAPRDIRMEPIAQLTKWLP